MISKALIAAVSSLLIILSGCGDDKVQETKASSQDSKIYITGNITGATAAHRDIDNEADLSASFEDVLDNIVFIGDSVTSGFGNYQKVPMDEVFAKTGVGPSNIREYTFDYNGGEYDALTILGYESPEYVVISMGLNDINTYTPEDFSELYMDFVNDAVKASSSSQFYIFSVTPVAIDCENISNDTIDSINAQLEKTVSEYGSNIHYVDCNSVLKDENGCMNEDYSGGDGIHFNSEAYDIILEQLKKSIV